MLIRTIYYTPRKVKLAKSKTKPKRN